MKKILTFLLAVSLFACNSTSDQSNESANEDMQSNVEKGSAEIDKLFEVVNVVKMHLFSVSDENPDAESYPYVGKVIPKKMHDSLGENLKGKEGNIHACYLTENSDHYILRIPSESKSGDLVLAQWDEASQKLIKINDLTHLSCEDGTCHQQDAWLTDLDDDRDLELVIRKHTRDDQGNISEEQFMVSTDNGSGKFDTAPEALAALAVKDRYVMQ